MRADGGRQNRCAAGDRSVRSSEKDGADRHEPDAGSHYRVPEGDIPWLYEGPVRKYRGNLCDDSLHGGLFWRLAAGKKDYGGRLWFYTC